MIGRAAESVSEALQVLAATKQSWLLILDNADDPNFDYQLYLPSGTHGAVIITSRIPECRKYGTIGAEPLEGLDEEQSQELLLKAAELPRESWSSHGSHANEVVRLLGSHTLALIQAGAYISNGHCQLHEYPEVYHQQRKRLLAFRPKQAQSRYCDVYATFEASAAVLKQSESEAARDALELLAILSMLDSSFLLLQIFKDAWHGGRDLRADPSGPSTRYDPSIDHLKQLPSFMVEDSTTWDPYRLIEASSLLASHSLVIRHDSNISPGLSMHVLIHAWAKERQSSEQQSTAWIKAGCVLALSRCNPKAGHIPDWHLLPHVQSYLDIPVSKALSFGLEVIVVPILLACGLLLNHMRQDSRLSYLLEDMFLELGENPDEVSQESLPLYILQVRNLSNKWKSKKAVHLAQQVDKINEDILAADDRDRLKSQHALAVAYMENGQTKEAIDLLEQVVKIEATILAADDHDQLSSRHALAVAYQRNEQTKEAIDLLEQIVKIEATILAVDNPSRLASQHELAVGYYENGQIEDAIDLLEQVVKIKATILAFDNPSRLASQHALAVGYWKNGQIEDAIDLLEQVVKIEATILAADDPDRLVSQYVLAVAYQKNGQRKEAISLLEQVVKIKATILAADDPDRLVSHHALAVAYQKNGQRKEAISLLEQVVKVKATILAIDDPDRLALQHELAVGYMENGQIEDAIDLLEQVVKIKATILAVDNPDRLVSQHALAVAYERNGQIKEAIGLLEHVVKIEATILAADDPSRLTSQHALAVAYQKNGQIKEAIGLLEHVVKIEATILAADDPDRLVSQHALAVAYRENGQLEEAIDLEGSR